MTSETLPPLPPYAKIRELLETERATIIKVEAFSEADDFVRSVENAQKILSFLEEIQTDIWNFFKEFPFLKIHFENEFMLVQEFFSRTYLLNLCFLDDFLFPERLIYPLAKEGKISDDLMAETKNQIKSWIEEKKKTHNVSLEELKAKFHIELKESDLKCSCPICVADYRNKLRETIFKECTSLIEETREKIKENIQEGIRSASNIFYSFQKDLDRLFFKFRKRLKKSTLNKLESQIKSYIKTTFFYPSELALDHTQNLYPYFHSLLKAQGLKQDLVSERDYGRFFTQLASNFWRGENYLEREFKKLVSSVLILKRKDVSGKILQDYLGEFWIHSLSRTIKRKIIYHAGPTNSGKTYHAVQSLVKAGKGCYLAPLRLLAAELYDTLNSKGVKTTLLTGEEIIEIENASHYSSTIEMARLNEAFDSCVIDEIQMITDPQRGWAWTRALVNIMAQEVHICGDPSVLDLIQKIVDLCGDTLEVIYYERMAKLSLEPRPIRVGELEKHDALIVFSRRNALRFKMDLEKLDYKVSIVYGRLSPEVRREQARKFDKGETDILVATDAISMGMNLPIKRIVFSTLTKYIDNQEFPLSKSEIKQISGRAGRYKRFPEGKLTCLSRVENGIDLIQEAIKSELEQKTQCMVGPDLDIFSQVNTALKGHGLPILSLTEFLRLFNTMEFRKPFFCVDLSEMIEIAQMVEGADKTGNLSPAEVFGFSCAPVNLGLLEHVQYFVWILNSYVKGGPVNNEEIAYESDEIDYLETSIKCVELYQWLSRHFNNKNFDFDQIELLENKTKAIEKLNSLLSQKIVPTCNSCGVKLPENTQFAICDTCFRKKRTFNRRPREDHKKKERGPRSRRRR
jgi:ATP-dependent RNA helicase SUPV3L1/SUV3